MNTWCSLSLFILHRCFQLDIAESELNLYLSNEKKEKSRLEDLLKNHQSAGATLKERRQLVSICFLSVIIRRVRSSLVLTGKALNFEVDFPGMNFMKRYNRYSFKLKKKQ